MAKMYYSIEEVAAKLSCDEAHVRALVRDGKLREFRDGGKVTYRVDEVDKIASPSKPPTLEDSGELQLADDEEITLKPAQKPAKAADPGSGAPLDLGGSDSLPLTLDDSGAPEPPKSGSGSRPAVSPPAAKKKGGSGSFSLEDSGGGVRLDDSGAAGGSHGGDLLSLDEVEKDAAAGVKKDDTVITNIGINVFDGDDLEIAADPMAATLRTGGEEHLGLSGSDGGGSGLMDLTREADDTSLGAELLEGIDMGDTADNAAQKETKPAVAAGPEEDEEEELAEPAMDAAWSGVPAFVGVVEPVSPVFTGLLVAATLTLGLLGALTVAISMGAWPGYLAAMSQQFLFVLLGTLLAGGLGAGIGWFVGQQAGASRKPKKDKGKKDKAGAKKGKDASLDDLDEALERE